MNRLNLTLALTFVVALFAAGSASAQTQLLNVDQELPLAAVLDNPCTAAVEAISFTGKTQMHQEVWLMPGDKPRIVLDESTTLQGTDTAVLFGEASATYVASSSNSLDLEFFPGPATLMNFKKVNNTASPDDFHVILTLDFDPLSLKLTPSLAVACNDGSPQP
jgi:hypothetical protein